MKKRMLGRTGLSVSELSMGGLFVASFAGEFEQARAAVKRAAELGINYIDTAPGYGNSEENVGRILPEIEPPLIVSTKLGGRPQPFLPQDRDGLMKSVEESLRLLHRDTIDMLIIHEPDRPGQYDWWSDWDRFTGPVLDVLDDLKRQGIIRYTGLGGTTAYEMARIMRTGRFDVVLTAYNYSLLWREAEIEILPLARELGMGIIVGSPLQQGALAKRYDDQIQHGAPWMSPPRRNQYKKLYALCDELKMPVAELAIRFVLSNPDISCVLMGARSPQEVEANVASAEKGPLSKEILARIDAISALVPFRPFAEPFGLGWILGGAMAYKGPGTA